MLTLDLSLYLNLKFARYLSSYLNLKFEKHLSFDNSCALDMRYLNNWGTWVWSFPTTWVPGLEFGDLRSGTWVLAQLKVYGDFSSVSNVARGNFVLFAHCPWWNSSLREINNTVDLLGCIVSSWYGFYEHKQGGIPECIMPPKICLRQSQRSW